MCRDAKSPVFRHPLRARIAGPISRFHFLPGVHITTLLFFDTATVQRTVAVSKQFF